MKAFFAIILLTVLCVSASAQNVGIGTSTPQYKLDIAGNMSLRNGAQTAGVYFDGATTANRAFAGIYTDNLGGFYGNGAGWNLLVNMSTGNVGIGVAPAAGLDIDGGNVRLRSGSPAFGAALMSADASGNAVWKKPVVFRVSGSPDPTDDKSLPNNQWVKPEFTTIADYNIGLAWAPIAQYFTAPVKGVYHFDFALTDLGGTAYSATCRIMRKRNGVDTEVYYANNSSTLNGSYVEGYFFTDACVDLALEPSDQVWVEVRTAGVYGVSYWGTKEGFSFSGRLVSYL